MNLADGIARLGVRGSRHRTRVQHDEIRRVVLSGGRQSTVEEPTADRRSVRFRRTAAEIFDGKSRHVNQIVPKLSEGIIAADYEEQILRAGTRERGGYAPAALRRW